MQTPHRKAPAGSFCSYQQMLIIKKMMLHMLWLLWLCQFWRVCTRAYDVTWVVCLAVCCGKHPCETCHLSGACYYHFPCHASAADWWLFQMGHCATCLLQSAYSPFWISFQLCPTFVYSIIPPLLLSFPLSEGKSTLFLSLHNVRFSSRGTDWEQSHSKYLRQFLFPYLSHLYIANAVLFKKEVK